MKEIGTKLEEARLSMDISLEEAASDLKLRPSQLENIEQGNRSAFKDVFELKQIIRDYAKYLSLEYEKLEDEFNEFVFEYTSKIPLEERKVEKREIISPYTIEHKRQFPIIRFLIILLLLVSIGLAGYLIIDYFNNEETVNATNLTYFIREWFYEFS